MKQILGAILASLIFFNAGLHTIHMDEAERALVALATGTFITGLTFYLGPSISTSVKSMMDTWKHE